MSTQRGEDGQSAMEVRGLVVRYGTGRQALTAVDQVDLTVPEGGTLGIVGESGCGKSTIAKALVGLVPVAEGSINLGGEDFTRQSARASANYRRRVQMIFQDPHSSLNPRMTAGMTIAEALAHGTQSGLSRADRRREVSRLLDLVQLPESAADRYPHQFSGGQKQRIAIARALAVGARVIINDEVTSALDVSVQATIINLLRDLQRERGLSYVFISHDLSVVRAVSDVVAVMYLGRVVELAPADEVFDAPTHPYTRALVASIPTMAEATRSKPLVGEIPDPRNPPTGCHFHTRCSIGPLYRDDRPECATDDPRAGAAERLHRAACHFAPSAPAVVAPTTGTRVAHSA
ncbi:ABC transporter ATP-binding protein [Actinophytocola oryzae]|uniref:Peptide/nickel transport system ATP-binding protein n=1 Tax=Actinophytocola oryzae TaxID=502181 RepID=A0A4R7W116_9PSEU|nr:ABC transporter ATP-binding protein [Actinophytocola oryzae]TDV56223.1 peptide/nickel transport system ATP-binding protein [Actinophytocola oryzae]